jgi:hypothetical protein
MSSDSDRDLEREQALRRLLADAVEPIEPAPGAQTRLLARARAHRRRTERPLMARWAPAALATLLVILGVMVVFAVRGANRSNGSNASSAAGSAAGAPSQAAESTAAQQPAAPESAAAASAAASALAPVPQSKQLSSGAAFSGTDAGRRYIPTPDAVPAALAPSDLDRDGRPDTFTLGAGTLAAQLSGDGLEAVSLPPLGPGAKVLGVRALTDPNGAPVAVVFVRLRQVGASATDTLAALVDGRLTVLKQGSGPALLTVDSSHGYTCNQGTLTVSGSTTPLVVHGAKLVASPAVRAAAAAPNTSTACF